jgi:hypothetical protein
MLLEDLSIVGRKLLLLLDVDAAYFAEKFALLVPLHQIDENVQLSSAILTREIELSPPERQTSKLLSFLTLNVFSSSSRHLYSMLRKRHSWQMGSPLCSRIARPVEHFLQWLLIGNSGSTSGLLH